MPAHDVRRSTFDAAIVTMGVVACIISLNVIGIMAFARLDWTADKQFTLSRATRRALASLTQTITVRAYFTADLPPPYGTQTRYVRDMLESYYAQASNKFRFEFIDPGQQISQEHDTPQEPLGRDIFGRAVQPPTAMERELEAAGIVPVQVRVNEADKVEVKRAFMGMSLELGDKKEVIPVLTNTQGLEYDLTTLIRKMSRQQTPRLGLLRGHGGVDPAQDMRQAMGALTETYAVEDVNLADTSDLKGAQAALEGLDALLVVGPKTALAAHELEALRTFIAAGHAVGVFAGPVQSNLQTLEVSENASGLEAIFAELGVEVQQGLVLDAECASLNVTQQAGFMRVAQPVNYPFIGQSSRLDSSNVTANLERVVLPFMGPLKLAAPEPGKGDGVHREVWVSASAQSWVQKPPYDLNPMQRWMPDRTEMAAHPLVVAVRGPLLQPARATAAEASSSQAAPTQADTALEGRVVLAAGHDFLLDAYLQKPNEALLLNMTDWLLRDDDLLAVRTRGLAAAPLEAASASKRQAIKLSNIVGLPALLITFGLWRWRQREARRHVAAWTLSATPHAA